QLFKTWNDKPRQGEHDLAMNLYVYLHDQGIDFTIEPRSRSGRPDLVALSAVEPLVADAKVFNPQKSKGISYLLQGTYQLYTYACDYNESCGYLVVFKTCRDELQIVAGGNTHGVPF